MDEYLMWCPNCKDQYEAIKLNPDFECINCHNVYDMEDGRVINVTDAKRYQQEFQGAKVAGMIPEKEFEGDREQMRRERW